MTTTIGPPPTRTPTLSQRWLYALLGGYLLMGLGLAGVKWPLLRDVSTIPLYEGVTLCLLAAMSGLALLGSLDRALTDVVVSCSLVVVIVAVVPWRYVWAQFVRTPADPWR